MEPNVTNTLNETQSITSNEESHWILNHCHQSESYSSYCHEYESCNNSILASDLILDICSEWCEQQLSYGEHHKDDGVPHFAEFVARHAP